MPIKTKVVPDSNVFIAAALNKSYCHDWLFGASEPLATYELYTSEDILREVSEKLSGKFSFARAEITKFLTDLDRVLVKVRPSIELNVVRDPKDNIILECAIETNAQLVISFDKDLLSLKTYENVQIAHPRMVQHWFQKSQ
jgi:putative PIN family toxin of toxin-antitoxin system